MNSDHSSILDKSRNSKGGVYKLDELLKRDNSINNNKLPIIKITNQT